MCGGLSRGLFFLSHAHYKYGKVEKKRKEERKNEKKKKRKNAELRDNFLKINSHYRFRNLEILKV